MEQETQNTYQFEYNQEYIEGFRYKQPVERVNGKTYWEYPEDSYERKNWANMYWNNYRERSVKDICSFDSHLWKNTDRQKIWDKVWKHEINPDRGGYATTALFDYEIWLIEQGWELHMGQLGSNGGRSYKKNGKWLQIEYGVMHTSRNDKGEIVKEYYKWAVSTNAAIHHMPMKEEEFTEYA